MDNNILFYSRLSMIAYKSNERIKEEIAKITNSYKLDIIEIDDLKALVIERRGIFYIAIRGTANLKNWINTNAKFSKESFIEGKVHKGFKSASIKLLDRLKLILDKESIINITGHSLGAALTNLIADNLVDQGYNVLDVYLFGCPKIGNSKYRKWSEQNLYNKINVLNDIDVIYNAPPFFLGYSALDVDIFFTSNCEYYVNPSKFKIHLHRILKIKKDILSLIELAEDHSMKNYYHIISHIYLEKMLNNDII